jgi:preprotein translocase subunit SecA
VFTTLAAKREAVVAEVLALQRAGRAVLIGTPSVDASEALGTLLQARGVAHRILNARFHRQEAEIVAQAGQPGKITIATNMAGRGTDIPVHEHVRSLGGLHVIATEMHSSARIDRQLIGRTARQGDPGTYRFFLSLEDELFRFLPPADWRRIQSRAHRHGSDELPGSWLRVFRQVQARIERTHRGQRKKLMRSEDVEVRQAQQMGLDPYLEWAE